MTHLDRRHFLAAGAGLLLGGGSARAAPLFPAEKNLQSGDLLWPKKPGAYIPYAAVEPSDDEAAWEAERQEALAALRAELNVNTAPRLRELKDLTFASFRQRYYNGVVPGQTAFYASGGVAGVGHVGIVETTADGAFVLDANPRPGVARTAYADWIRERPEHAVWQGRLKNRTARERHAVAVEAARYIARPYRFWNFDLNDDAGFYCSKLVWMAAFRALGMPLDGNPEPQRSFWYSPKQCLNSPEVEIVLNQGDYTWD